MANPACVTTPHITFVNLDLDTILHRDAASFRLRDHHIEANVLLAVVVLVLVRMDRATVSDEAAEVLEHRLCRAGLQIVGLNDLTAYLPNL
jgi:hypothetical protein